MKGVYIIGNEMINLSLIKEIHTDDNFICFVSIAGGDFVFDSDEYDIEQIWEQIEIMQVEGYAVVRYE